jgi:hypothetical protein
MGPFVARGVDPELASVFQALLRDELSVQGGVQWAGLPAECSGSDCVLAAGSMGAQILIFGELNALGARIIVSASAREAGSGRLHSAQRMTVDQPEELEQVAERFARALLGGPDAKKTPELGNVTQLEAVDPLRREGRRGPGLRLGGIVPLDDGYAGADLGAAIDLSYWFEALDFGIEPRLGVHFTPGGTPNRFVEVPFDIGAYYIATRGDVAPFIGGGAGLRYVYERRRETVTTGSVISTTHEATRGDSAFGVGVFGRAGLLLLRTYSMRLALTLDVNVAFVTLNGRANPISATGGLGVFF